jgi:hypothetical protein
MQRHIAAARDFVLERHAFIAPNAAGPRNDLS